MKILNWIKHRLQHKLEHFSLASIKKTLKENGLALVIIIVGWEIAEDVIFPVLFVFLGNHVHPAFYAGAPASLLLCFHWLAVPLMWGWWMKIKRVMRRLNMTAAVVMTEEVELALCIMGFIGFGILVNHVGNILYWAWADWKNKRGEN